MGDFPSVIEFEKPLLLSFLYLFNGANQVLCVFALKTKALAMHVLLI